MFTKDEEVFINKLNEYGIIWCIGDGGSSVIVKYKRFTSDILRLLKYLK
jgi:hypothetical protein